MIHQATNTPLVATVDLNRKWFDDSLYLICTSTNQERCDDREPQYEAHCQGIPEERCRSNKMSMPTPLTLCTAIRKYFAELDHDAARAFKADLDANGEYASELVSLT